MKKQKLKLLTISSTFLMGAVTCGLLLNGKINFKALKAGDEPRVLSVLGSAVAEQATDEFSSLTFTAPVDLEAGGHYDVELEFSSAKKVGETLVLESGSTISKTEKSYGLESITASFTGELDANFGFYVVGDYYGSLKHLVSGEATPVGGNDFLLTAKSETVLESLQLTYSCRFAAEMDGAIDFDDAGSSPSYTLNHHDGYMTVDYDNIGGSEYDKSIGLNVPASISSIESNTLRLFVKNNGLNSTFLRLDVETDSVHGEHDIHAINTTGKFNDDSSRVETDLEWGGSKVTLASGEQGILTVNYDIDFGEVKTLRIFADSARGDSETYASSLMFANPVFTNERYGLEFDAGDDTPYTCVYNSRKGSTRVTYASATRNTWKVATAWLGTAEQMAGKTTIAFDVKNNGENATQIEFDVRTEGQNNHLIIKNDDTHYDWYNDDHRAQYNVAPGATRRVELVIDQTDGAANLLEAMIDTTWGETDIVTLNGDIEFLNLVL